MQHNIINDKDKTTATVHTHLTARISGIERTEFKRFWASFALVTTVNGCGSLRCVRD
jgi:hypothetical protein